MEKGEQDRDRINQEQLPEPAPTDDCAQRPEHDDHPAEQEQEIADENQRAPEPAPLLQDRKDEQGLNLRESAQVP